ncbi:hypothetical protein BQ8482_120018 [Mesorhizobium delmotii]|uniref:Uncharacterized protein n=1 Tax=Mesorhizobium delmotii TaxID=1631247 RepID=A0A2P9AFQ7_9HYPH|nr:hypothetical protein BQ8482_120018 [Mesorhizobium delmotii]
MRNPRYRRQRHHYDRGNGRIRGRNVDRHLSIHQTMAAHSKNTNAAPAINIPLRVRHLGGSAGTSLNRWACSVASFSRAAAVSRGVHPFASEAVTKAANATSKATSQLIDQVIDRIGVARERLAELDADVRRDDAGQDVAALLKRHVAQVSRGR